MITRWRCAVSSARISRQHVSRFAVAVETRRLLWQLYVSAWLSDEAACNPCINATLRLTWVMMIYPARQFCACPAAQAQLRSSAWRLGSPFLARHQQCARRCWGTLGPWGGERLGRRTSISAKAAIFASAPLNRLTATVSKYMPHRSCRWGMPPKRTTERKDLAVVQSNDARWAGLAIYAAHLAEELAGPDDGQRRLATFAVVYDDLHLTRDDRIEHVAFLVSTQDRAIPRASAVLDSWQEVVKCGVRKTGE